ncbi:hypothetical protein F511_20259 [Dorcoceras hygrometricum]|uniref:Uncharacterized protein n=1 Tax=Dorcoceras hygrometricum TaxID=472368 RepID=A0A2Z7C2P9_9LAMI|nr:hypothetical protein F511_20259 [Dorcoceras hygrometricum]
MRNSCFIICSLSYCYIFNKFVPTADHLTLRSTTVHSAVGFLRIAHLLLVLLCISHQLFVQISTVHQISLQLYLQISSAVLVYLHLFQLLVKNENFNHYFIASASFAWFNSELSTRPDSGIWGSPVLLSSRPNKTLEEISRHDVTGALPERRPSAAVPHEIFARQPCDVAPSATHGRAQGAALSAHRPASSGALHVPSSPTSVQQASPEQPSPRDQRPISSREAAPSVAQRRATKRGQRAGSRVGQPRRATSARCSGRSPSATGELRASMRKLRPALTQNCATLAQKSGIVDRPLRVKRAAVCAWASTTIGKSRVAKDPISMRTSWRSNSDIVSVTSIGYPRMSASGESSTTMHRLLHASGSHPIPTPYDPKRVDKRVKVRFLSRRVSMTFRVVRTNQYNQDLGLIHSTNGNHLESPNEGSSIDHQVTIYLHAQNITMFPTNETWYFASQKLVSSSGGLILIWTAQSTRNMFRIHSDY